MLTLSLLRHAKSSWKNPSLPDKERSLSSRGRVAAPLMGRAIAERGLVPDLVLCSSSRRTRETLDLALPAWTPEPRLRYEDALYHADPDTILEQVQIEGGSAGHVMVIGHNPGFHEFAFEAVGAGPQIARDKLNAKLPTCGLVVILFPSGRWEDIGYGKGTLSLFLVPEDLGLAPSPIDP